MKLLRDVGAVLEGHFRYTSGRHGGLYVEKFRLLEDPAGTAHLSSQIAGQFRGQRVELVVGPTTGGIVLAYEVARQLKVHSFFAERTGAGPERAFARGFQFRPGQRTLVVDDVLTTGGSIRETIEAVRTARGDPIGVGVVVDRSGGRTEFGLPFFACMTLDIETFDSDDCPLCRDGVALVET
ncbi:MAG: orotate phosphoribosyltransferase [Dehalococcoidia bacterium]